MLGGETASSAGVDVRRTGSGNIGAANTVYGIYARTSAGLVIERNRVSNPGMVVTAGSYEALRLLDA